MSAQHKVSITGYTDTRSMCLVLLQSLQMLIFLGTCSCSVGLNFILKVALFHCSLWVVFILYFYRAVSSDLCF